MKESEGVLNNAKSTKDYESDMVGELLLKKAEEFFSSEVATLSQEEVDAQTEYLLQALAENDVNTYFILSTFLPKDVSEEEIKSGTSSWSKIYRAIYTLSAKDTYKKSRKLQTVVEDLECVISQNPQMIGPVTMWKMVKDIMWRKDIPAHAKSSLMGSMTYALAFFNTDTYESELLKHLDFEENENYAEVAHMLEALKQFWSSGHESYAQDRVPDFYLRALRKIKDTPGANYLLSVRAREILSLLEQSGDFPYEARDLRPFELSKGVYASTQVSEGLTIVPEESISELREAIENFNANEENLTPPQWMVDEALARGEKWVSWQPPRDLIMARKQLFNDMHKHATIPIEEKLGEIGGDDVKMKQELLFDYEHLVSRPVREMIQREFDFKLSDLSIREQFYFLNYFKNTTVATVETMKLFISNFGVDAMRAFLVNQHDENASENIMITGVMYEEEAKPLFRAYAQTLDAGERFAQQLKVSTGSKETNLLMDEVQEGLLKRAGHLFFASKQMGLSEYVEDHGYNDIVQAFSGVAKMQETLSRIGQDEVLVVKRNHAREGSKNPLHDSGSETFYFDLEDSDRQEKLSLKVFVRPTANSEGEARINFELNLDDLPEESELKEAFTQTTVFKERKKTVTQSVIRFGFDLDSKTNPPTFSFDMGRSAYAGSKMERTGDVLGNILQSVAPEGSHMTDFSEHFSDPENFKKIALSFKQYFKNLGATQVER